MFLLYFQHGYSAHYLVLWTGQLIRQWPDLWHWRRLRNDGVRQEVSRSASLFGKNRSKIQKIEAKTRILSKERGPNNSTYQKLVTLHSLAF